MQKYIIGLITGIFFTVSFFILVAAKSMVDHTHDADEINYSEYSYGGWGTLQKKIEDMDDEIEELDDDKADEDHTHSKYEIYWLINFAMA